MRNIDWNKGLIPAIVQDSESGLVLMLGFVNEESWAKTLATKQVTFFSRSRGKLWTKGETSGNYLDYVDHAIDCDGDTILIQAVPRGPVCHTGDATCFGAKPTAGSGFLRRLSRVIDERFLNPPEGSYIGKLIARGTDRMIQKVGEEAVETVIEAKNQDLAKFESEAADLVFHLMVLLRAKGSSLAAVEKVLSDRHARN